MSQILGRYSDLIQIHHTKEEFILKFYVTGGGDSKFLIDKIYLNPNHAKRFLDSLKNNIEKYEDESYN